MTAKRTTQYDRTFLFYLVFVCVISMFTYFYRYDFPSSPYWDEPYHIASAQKYLTGTYFMEQHPPLGKMLIALGEKILHPNEKVDQFITTDYARNFPEGFSFAGYRLFPALLAWLTAPLFFLIFFFFTRQSSLSTLLSFLYIFDNSQIVHSRGAMVDSPLTFFGILMILIFLHLTQKDRKSINTHILLSFSFGLVFALAFTTKLVALILILLLPAAVFLLLPDWRKTVLLVAGFTAGFILAYVAVWQTHFSLGKTIVPELSNSGYYEASDEYKAILAEKRNGSLASFPVMIRDSIKFVSTYSRGVPRLDLCKPDENGSLAYFWPFGARTIDYRWEKTPEGDTRYLYLVPNPFGWALGLLGVLLCVMMLVSTFFGDRKEKIIHLYPMLAMLALYFGYMIAISRLDRVMYLYHYFLPLLFSYILFGLGFVNITMIWKMKMSEQKQILVMTILGLLVFASFQFYRPLSYYEPLSDASFARRNVFSLWELTCVNCTKVSQFVVPRSN